MEVTSNLSGPALEKRLKQKRSKAYMDEMVRLDAMGAICDPGKVRELIQAMNKEFADISSSERLIGLVAKCYLGAPYEVHVLDMLHDIVEHYEAGRALPDGLEKARVLARHPGYAFIEVYTNSICAISADGQVAYTRGN